MAINLVAYAAGLGWLVCSAKRGLSHDDHTSESIWSSKELRLRMTIVLLQLTWLHG